ncbi:hypothetical protein CVT24_003463 [Panaeolus cyanescens]|uniref:Golgi to ER traffic protein 2 n=1 Tax=Panaeolus cyanescens TaxID=181874 RepID=A0A409Y7F1_9AGAR|nr:hypothetical protein CVT24_003463 [Panaeolus cyanescens]
MSAAARAEARKKAILSRGNDRLAKLTTSARGEEAPYLHDDPPLVSMSKASRNFLGEESADMPTPQRVSVSPSPSPGPAGGSASASTNASPQPSTQRGTTPSRNANIFEGLGSSNPADPSVWLPEQQQQFLQALMNASMGAPGQGQSQAPPLPLSSPIGDPIGPVDPTAGMENNPFAALLGAGGPGAGGPQNPLFPPGMMPVQPEPPKEQTKLQKALPLIHLVAMWCLLAYFVLWVEPNTYMATTGRVDGGVFTSSFWARWADLGTGRWTAEKARRLFLVQAVPFFWAFTTLQIALHSLRIFSGYNAVQPPTLLALALPHLPPPIPSLIINSLKYVQMGSLFLDDLAVIVVGLGFLVYFAGWMAPPQGSLI